MNKQFNETELENAIIKLFKKNGYLYSNGETIHRKYTDILLRDDLLSFIKNRFKDLSDKEYEKIIAHIENITSSPLFIGNKETHKIITEGFNLIHDNKNQLTTHINYIDFEHPENNIFRIVNQYTVEDVEIRRPDLLIFINGIPLIIFEFKSAIAEEATIFDA
ncbi:MAG: type I restriction endonuclease [Mycoplasmoidaceae bacterium]|nr:type I restriction endonuclease [Mycoplasmoidaceae bacterium]